MLPPAPNAEIVFETGEKIAFLMSLWPSLRMVGAEGLDSTGFPSALFEPWLVFDVHQSLRATAILPNVSSGYSELHIRKGISPACLPSGSRLRFDAIDT